MIIQSIVIVVYLLITIAIGLVAKRRSNNSAAFHGIGLGVIMCVAAGTGEWLGGTSTTGVAEYGYAFGLSGSWYTIANGVGVIVLALFFAKLYRSLETVTVPGIVGKYIGGGRPGCFKYFVDFCNAGGGHGAINRRRYFGSIGVGH
jgi:SSS family solute:Na+ symporter